MAQRLALDAEFDAEDVEADLDATLDDTFDLERPIGDGEVSIAKWADGDPQKALAIADHQAEKRRRLLLKARLIRGAYEEKKAVLDAWLVDYEESIEADIDFLDHLLEQYQRDFHPDEKTVRLSTAELRRRKQRDHREWDEDAALRYQEEMAQADVTRKLNKSALLDRLEKQDDGSYIDTTTGEIVEFVREVPPEEPESFSIAQELPET